MNHDDIRIGTLATDDPAYLEAILPLGFESFQINMWQQTPKTRNLKKLAKQYNDVLDRFADDNGWRPVISSLGPFGNPLQEKGHADMWKASIDACELFGCDIVAGFAGAMEDRPLPESMPQFKKVFGPLAKRAADKGVRLAFENCLMGGSWERPRFNIATCPMAWELMFDTLGNPEHVGLEWEPCHQMALLIDPLPQLRQWVGKVVHVHGKDGTIMWEVVKNQGISCGEPFMHHRTPGFGDTNWTDVISILRMGGYTGSIDIEGWHDPVYRGDMEMTGQVHGLNHLKQCRGGAFVPNPKV